MKLSAQRKLRNRVQFLDDGAGGIIQTIPLSNQRCLIASVAGFKEFEYSFEGAVPFSSDARLAFNRKTPEPQEVRTNGFHLIGKEFNRIARLSGTQEPEVIESFRTRLDNRGELLTFLAPSYREAGRVVSPHSLGNLAQSDSIPERVCLATIEVRCERNFDYIPSRGAYFFFYYPEKVRVVSHIVHSGPPLDCPGEEWEAKAYEGPLESGIYKFFAHNDGAVSIEMQTLPHGLLPAALGKLSLEHVVFSQATLSFSPVMVRNTDARYAFSPPEVPDRGNMSHLTEFQQCLEILHGTICRVIEGKSCALEGQIAQKQGQKKKGGAGDA